MRTLIAGLLLAASCGSYGADAMTGNDFYELCKPNAGPCIMYVIGLTDGLLLGAGFGGVGGDFEKASRAAGYCTPKNVSYKQMTDVVIKHLKDNPATRHEILPTLAIISWRAAWPCK